MSSYLRRLERKFKREQPGYESPAQQYRAMPDGGYAVLHPTKGWRSVSPRRLRAQKRMAELLGHA